MSERWVYRNDGPAPVKVRVGSRAFALRPGQTLHVPEGTHLLTRVGGLSRIEHQQPRARYFAADKRGVLAAIGSDADGVTLGDDDPELAPDTDDPPRLDDAGADAYADASDDTEDDDEVA